jgi:hypothetical protein
MKQIIVGIIITCSGIAIILFREKIIEEVIKVNNEGLGFYRYDNKERKRGLWYLPLFGALVIALGILVLIGIFKLPQ